MKLLKHFSILSLFITFNTLAVMAQDRAVAVVYDNSGSMTQSGQCEGINYASQVMIGLLHPKDELWIYRMLPAKGDKIDLSNKKNGMKAARKSYNCNARNTPFEAAIQAKEQLSKSSKKYKTLIILSDGGITDPNFAITYPDELRQLVEETGTRIFFLNVSEKQSVLDDYLENSQTPNHTLRTQGSFEEIIGQMEQIAAGIMTLSGSGLSVTPKDQSIEWKSPVPLKRIIVLQQDAQSNAQLARLVAAKSEGNNLRLGESFEAQKAKGVYKMTGLINHIEAPQSGQVIPKGNIELGFNKSIDASKIKILPEVAAKLEIMLNSPTRSQKGNQYVVCDTVQTLEIGAKLVDFNGKMLDMPVLKESNVVFIDETTQQKIRMKLNENTGAFFAKVPFKNERLVVSVAAEFSGYFNFQSQVLIVTKDNCPRPKAFIQADKQALKAKVTEMDKAGSLVITPQIIVENEAPREPTAKELEDMYMEQVGDVRIGIEVEKRDGKMYVRPTTFMCACFTTTGKDQLQIQLKSTNPNLIITERGKLTIDIEIEDVGFWEKCGWLVIAAIVGLILLWYIFGIIRKPRFCSGTEIIVTKKSRVMTRKPKSYPLPTGFFNRYFVPYIPEKRTVGSVTFKAGARCSHVLIAANTQNDKMYVSGFPLDNPGKKDVRLSNAEKLEISRQNGKEIYEYHRLT
ncbi:MAG: hypothetical protein AB8B69_27680 [Chitinophagales bacterium]